MNLLRPFRLRPAFFTGLLHIALVIILIGACVTHFFGEQGQVHLRLFETSSLTTSHSTLSLYLWDFQITEADYITELRILDRSRKPLTVDAGTIRMNKPLRYHGYRFCQADYDSDGRGVVLSYNYDPWGTGITYAGYALLLVAMVGFFFQRRTVFRCLWNRQHRPLMLGLGALILVLAAVMTRVVTPKPPLQPVLQTPLLGIHVSVIMVAYTLFAVIMILGIIGLCKKNSQQSSVTYQLSALLLYPAEFCLTAGIFIGAVWANLSWGRYWGWDPKETWALITMFVYAGLLHWPQLKRLFRLSERTSYVAYHVYCIVAFLFVLFTYFGVTYLLGGLHSYA